MACDECDKSRAMGYKFCIKCGQSFAASAPVPVHTVEKKGPFDESVLEKIVIPSMIVIFIACIASAAVVLMDFNATLEFFGKDGVTPWIYFFAFFKPFVLSGAAAQAFWVFLAVVLIACIVLFFYDSREAFRFNSGDYMEKTRKTPLFWVGLLLGSTLMIEIIMNLVFTAIGMGITTPGGLIDMNLEESLKAFTFAAVWEEVMFRMVMFGLPITIIALASREKGALKNLFGGFGASKMSILFLIFSTILFAVAHVDSWGVMKIFTVFIGGLVMGYTYMRFGIHVSIVCHMINDFAMVWSLGLGEIVAGLLLLGIFGLGLLNIPLLFKKTMKGIRKAKTLPATHFAVAAIDVPEPQPEPVQENVIRDDVQEEFFEGEIPEADDPEAQDDNQGPRID